jgi:hypothetical protein
MRTALRLALAVGLIFALLPLGVRAEQVNNWREGANYPAQITAIPIGDNKLTPNNSVRVGAWTVSFTRRPVIARYITEGGCTGSVRCAFVASFSNSCVYTDNTRGPQCYFAVYANDAPRLKIACPSSLGLN